MATAQQFIQADAASRRGLIQVLGSMAIFTATPNIPLKAALRKYPFRLLALLLQPLMGAALTQALPPADSYLSIALFLVCAGAAGWPVALRDAPIGYWFIAGLGWFCVSLLVPALPFVHA